MEKIISYTGRGSNGYFLLGEKNICVDSGNLASKEDFLAVCSQHGIAPESIVLILITHGHEDHFQNANAMREATGAPILCHEKAANALREGQKPHVLPRNDVGWMALRHGQEMERMMAEHPEKMPPQMPVEPVEPDMTFVGTYDLTTWGIRGKIVETPGHSEGCVSVVLESRAALVGDLIMTEPDSNQPTIAMFTYREGNNEEVWASVEKLLPFADVFYSGHGAPLTEEQVRALLAEEKG